MNDLVKTVKSDIVAFIGDNKKLLFNERDFQTQLAVWLQLCGNSYDNISLEYYVPRKKLEPDYIWNQELRLDIVVEKEGKFVPVELKYKTQKARANMPRFGEHLDGKCDVLKDQSAQDLGMYGFWKDVRRIELVRKRFSNVAGGLAVFLTNDAAYTKEPKETSNHRAFSMSAGPHPAKKAWLFPDSKAAKEDAKKFPAFTLERDYAIRWDKKEIEGIAFYYCLVSV